MSVAILSIGTELLRGDLVNTNAAWLAERVSLLGREVHIIETVDDDRERIQKALERLRQDHQFILCTGGLGPTTDDLTTECVATLLGLPLELDLASLNALNERFARQGRTPSESNRKQVYFPAGANVLPNPEGTAPGFSVSIGQSLACFMPGVPREMRVIFEKSIEPLLRAQRTRTTSEIVLRTFGLPESEVNDRLAGVEAQHRVLIGYRARFPEIDVKVQYTDEVPEQASAGARLGANEVVRRLGDVVYAEGNATLPGTVGSMLRSQGLTLALAESCTGGLLAELLTDEPNASEFFLGGVVAYSNRVKVRQLGVEPALLGQFGAVSSQVASAMAQGARKLAQETQDTASADLGLAITGIAGPGGGTKEKPVGLVYIALSTPHGVITRELTGPGSRDRIRRRAAFAALDMLRKWMLRP